MCHDTKNIVRGFIFQASFDNVLRGQLEININAIRSWCCLCRVIIWCDPKTTFYVIREFGQTFNAPVDLFSEILGHKLRLILGWKSLPPQLPPPSPSFKYLLDWVENFELASGTEPFLYQYIRLLYHSLSLSQGTPNGPENTLYWWLITTTHAAIRCNCVFSTTFQ